MWVLVRQCVVVVPCRRRQLQSVRRTPDTVGTMRAQGSMGSMGQEVALGHWQVTRQTWGQPLLLQVGHHRRRGRRHRGWLSKAVQVMQMRRRQPGWQQVRQWWQLVAQQSRLQQLLRQRLEQQGHRQRRWQRLPVRLREQQ